MFKKWYIYQTDPAFRTLKSLSLKNWCVTCVPFEFLNLTFSNADWKVFNRFGTLYQLNNSYFFNPKCRQPLRSEYSFDASTLAINLGVSIPILLLLCILALCVVRSECIYLSIILLQYINSRGTFCVLFNS